MIRGLENQDVTSSFSENRAEGDFFCGRDNTHITAQPGGGDGTESVSSVRTPVGVRELLSAHQKKNQNRVSQLPQGDSEAGLMHQEVTDRAHDEPAGKRGRFSMTYVNFWLDAALLVVFVGLGIVSVIVQFVFPPGIAARGWHLWGMTFGEWSSIQFGLLSVLAVGILVHIMFHWTWICGVVFRRLLKRGELPDDGIRTVIGVGFLIAILLTSSAVVGVAMMSIQQPEIHQAD